MAGIEAGERPRARTSTSDELGQDRLAALDEQPPRIGQYRPLRDSADEDRADLGLERGDLAGHGGLRVAELGRGGRKRPVTGDLAEDAETACIEHNEQLYLIKQTPICIYGVRGAKFLLLLPVAQPSCPAA